MNTYAIYLRPRGALASRLSSEMLFGAVCWGIQSPGLTDVGRLLKDQFAAPRFAFSAAFPLLYQLDDGQFKSSVRFYPRPVTFEVTPSMAAQAGTTKTAKLKVADTLKKEFRPVKFLSESIMQRVAVDPQATLSLWLTAALGRDEETNRYSTGDLQRVSGYLLSAAEAQTWDGLIGSKEGPRQHNQIDRLGGATVEGLLFYENEQHFKVNNGLWAVVRADQAAMDDWVRPALRLLADTGFGANRSVGKGQFDITVDDNFKLPGNESNANGFMSLSRYLPAPDEALTGEPLAYQLTTLRAKREKKFPADEGPQASPPIYKESVRVFEPGSIFPRTNRREVYGRLAVAIPETAPGGPTYQSGLAVPLFVKA